MLLLQYFMPDGGPRYTETDLTQLIAEPWNTASAFLFCALTAYWFWRIAPHWRRHAFMAGALLVLGIGSIGGLLYHGLRTSSLFLALDWIPILLLSLASSFYFAVRATNSWLRALAFAGLIIGLEMLNKQFMPPHWAGNITYLLLCILVVAPSVLLLYTRNWRHSKWVGSAFATFMLALACRFADPWELLPMGTHFLWHTFGAIACHLMFYFIYELNSPPPAPQQKTGHQAAEIYEMEEVE